MKSAYLTFFSVILFSSCIVIAANSPSRGPDALSFLKNYADNPKLLKFARRSFDDSDVGFLPHGCIAKHLNINQEEIPFRHLSVQDFENGATNRIYLDRIASLPTGAESYNYFLNALFLLFEPAEYAYLSMISSQDSGGFPPKEFQKSLEESDVVLQYMMAFYILGELAIPEHQGNIAENLERTLFDIYRNCGQMSPVLLFEVGDSILKVLSHLNDRQMTRDLWASNEKLSFEKEEEMFISNHAGYIASQLVESELDESSVKNVIESSLRVIEGEVSDTMLIAAIQYVRAICETNRVTWKSIFQWRLLNKCKATDYEYSDMWPSLAFFGRLFLKVGYKLLEYEASIPGSLLKVREGYQSRYLSIIHNYGSEETLPPRVLNFPSQY